MGLLMKQEASQVSLGIRNIPFSSLSRPTTVGLFFILEVNPQVHRFFLPGTCGEYGGVKKRREHKRKTPYSGPDSYGSPLPPWPVTKSMLQL